MLLAGPVTWPESKHAYPVQVAVGSKHALLLTDEGIVYSWGGTNVSGQLGRLANAPEKQRMPSPITVLKEKVVVQVACGMDHCLALTQEGVLFAWGANRAGQLGLDNFGKERDGANTALSHEQKKDGPSVSTPHEVRKFQGMLVRSCSAGPESSAAVTMAGATKGGARGEVWVWGRVSYYLFGAGKYYDESENCTEPVRLRAPRNLEKGTCPDQVALFKDSVACTLCTSNLSEHLASLWDSLRRRSNALTSALRMYKSEEKRLQGQMKTDGFAVQDLRSLDDQFKQKNQEWQKRKLDIIAEEDACTLELQRLSRDLTVCNQQDTAYAEDGQALEAEHNVAQQKNQEATALVIKTKLSDIDHFKASIRKKKLDLLNKQDEQQRRVLELQTELAEVSQKLEQGQGRVRLMESLKRGNSGSVKDTLLDEGLRIAMSKREELAATDPHNLAGVLDTSSCDSGERGTSRFSGFREVLMISDRALQDISSALREVSATVGDSDGAALEEVLEANLKLRKEYNLVIQEKMRIAERGKDAMREERRSHPENDVKGLLQFFDEAHIPKAALASDPLDAEEPTGGFFSHWG